MIMSEPRVSLDNMDSKYDGFPVLKNVYVKKHSLYLILALIGSKWRSIIAGVILLRLGVLVRNRDALFMATCNRESFTFGRPAYRLLQ